MSFPKEADTATVPNPPTSGTASADILARLRPWLLLIGATLQAADGNCPCSSCQVLRQHASELAPLILKLTEPGGE